MVRKNIIRRFHLVNHRTDNLTIIFTSSIIFKKGRWNFHSDKTKKKIVDIHFLCLDKSQHRHNVR